MSYRIRYDSRTAKYEVKPESRAGGMFLVVLGVIFAVGICISPELRAWVIPGEDRVTIQAFSQMTDDLRCGAAVSDALEAFCRRVIHGE